jgi:flagellar hook-associated protein 2
MGTVGLSFGSPTSGAGFDVSSTVSSIVANLQNVETPWKTQLTTLQAQDTTISSLGTLFSNLSNDMSSLTDLTGILSQKTGSSSDTNVLTLTSADNNAVAGTHTVTVSNLAQTSSGYLAPIINASAKLSGSITLQAGNGTAQTITLSSNNTLSGLAAAINASGAGITASLLTDSNVTRLSLVSSTSGAGGQISVLANTLGATTDPALGYTGSAGSVSQPSSGSFTTVASASDVLAGSFTVQVGSGTTENVVIGAVPSGGAAANTIYTGSGVNTLSGLASAITAANIGVSAAAVTNNDGSVTLSLTSKTSGTAGNLTVASSLADTTTALGYSSSVTGKDAALTIDGVALSSSSNTVANLIPGVTFQLLAPSATESDNSLEQIQVVIGNDNTGVESTFNQMVSDYNSLISAVNTQEGNTSSGTPEPLFGSPTLSLIQQQLLGGLNTANPDGYLAPITTGLNTVLSGSLTVSVGSGTLEHVVIGAAPSTPAANTVYTGSGVNTLAGLAKAINSADLGLTASVITSGTQSTLSLLSSTAGSSGAVSINSSIVATSDTPLSYSGTPATSTANATGTLTAITSTDAITGNLSIQVGSGASQSIAVPSGDATLAGLASAINSANIGVHASVSLANNQSTLTLLSSTAGTAGNLTVTSNVLDTTNTASSTLAYTTSSDINNLTTLGISVNNDGSLTFDATSLDSVLNSDFSSVVGFFQNANSWGQSFATMLTDSGSSSSTGILGLASSSNSGIESTLNADIIREQSIISAEQSSLTTELNSANEVMQQLPTQLQGVNELYSAITGYNENTNG